MNAEEMIEAMECASEGGHQSIFLTQHNLRAIVAKLRAAEELAAVVEDLYTEARPVHMETLFGPALELRLGNRLHDYRKAGTEEAKHEQ